MSILHELTCNSGRTMKEYLLSKASPELKKVFQYAYDYNKTYGVKFKGPFTVLEDGVDYGMMFMILDSLAERKVTGHAALSIVEDFAAVNGDLIKQICNRDLQVGISVATLNNVFGKGFVPMFEVQLAKEQPVEKVFFPIVAQLKYDGVRVIMLKVNGKITLRTRNGLSFSYPYLEKQLRDFPDNIMLDGELTSIEGKMEDRTKVSGTVNSALKGTAIIGQNLVYNVFDYMMASDFMQAKCDVRYSDRFGQLRDLLSFIAPEYDKQIIKLAEYRVFNDKDELNAHFEDLLAQGYEGLILKTWQHKYSFKRSTDWTKMKAIKDATLTCVGIQEGTGKYEGLIGALICEGVVEGKSVSVNVGSGLSDINRSLPFTDYIGKPIDIHYNTLIQDSKTGLWSLFLPRFIIMRGDLERK